MNRRHFLKQLGQGTALLGAGGSLVKAEPIVGKRWPLTGRPRSKEWVYSRQMALHPILSKGRRVTFLTGMAQPAPQTGWQLVERVPLRMNLAMKEEVPIPGSLICINELTYAWSEKDTEVGPIRVDFVQSRMTEILHTRMQVFDIELDGKPLGSVGLFEGEPKRQGAKAERLHTNWYSGVRIGDLACKIDDSKGFDPSVWRSASLAIWRKPFSTTFTDISPA